MKEEEDKLSLASFLPPPFSSASLLSSHSAAVVCVRSPYPTLHSPLPTNHHYSFFVLPTRCSLIKSGSALKREIFSTNILLTFSFRSCSTYYLR